MCEDYGSQCHTISSSVDVWHILESGKWIVCFDLTVWNIPCLIIQRSIFYSQRRKRMRSLGGVDVILKFHTYLLSFERFWERDL